MTWEKEAKRQSYFTVYADDSKSIKDIMLNSWEVVLTGVKHG